MSAYYSRLARRRLLVTTISLAAIAQPAIAQENTQADSASYSDQMSDIVVTARKRAERLFDVPVAVSAMGAQDLERYASNSISKIAETTTGLNIGARTAGGAGAGITIRGVGTDGSNVGIAQSVSISIDGVQTSRGRALWGSYFDLQQVEVMKGPQALFFGKNSPAGVVALTTRGPTDELEASFGLGYEFRADEIVADAAISGPLTEALGARVAVRVRNMKGYIRNDARQISTGMAAPYDVLPGADPRSGEREYAGRLTLAYDDGGPFSATLKLTGNHYKDDGAVYPLELINCGGNFPSNFNTVLLGTSRSEPVGDCKANWRTASSDPAKAILSGYKHGLVADGQQYSDVKTIVAALTMNYDFGNDVSLTSTTGYYDLNSRSLMNNDWTSFATIAFTEAEKAWQFSQELRMQSSFDGPFNFMIGGYFERANVHFDGSGILDQLPADPTTGKFQTIDKLAIEHGKTYSAFAQVTLDITPELELSGGARYTHETKRGYIANTFSNASVGFVPIFFPVKSVPARNTSNNVSPEVTLTYRPNDDLMVYGAFKTGYKAGGLNLSQVVTAGLTSEAASFGKETARGFEAGVKAKLFGNRADVQLTAYRYKYSDLQVSAFVPQLQTYVVSNAAASRNYGVELEGRFRATESLTLRSAIAYNHSRFLDFPNAACYGGQTAAQGCSPTGQDLSGRPTLTAPDWVATGGFDFDTPIFDNYRFGLTGDIYYSSDYYFIQTQSPFAQQKDFARFNASVRFYPEDKKWEFALIGRNLTNKKVLVSGQDTPLGGANGNPPALNGVLGRPREIMAQINFRF